MAKAKITCPKCGSTLMTYNPWLGQMWTCQHCGYKGPIEMVEDSEMTKKEIETVKEIEEDSKKEAPKKEGNYRKYVVMALAILILSLLTSPIALIGIGILLILYLVWK